jgi:UDP-N-acetyl-D-galactosamine dehydrogenase
MADPMETLHEYGVHLAPLAEFEGLDALILAVNHAEFLSLGVEDLIRRLNAPAVFIDVKSCFAPGDFPDRVTYWSL